MIDNLYAIIADNLFLVENEVENIIETLNVDPFNVLTYDLEESQLDELLQEITTISLLSDNKVIKVKNPWFFYEKRDEDLLPLINYFKNPKEDTTLIFMLTEDVNSQFLASKEAKKYLRFETIDSIKKDDLPNYVFNYFKQLNYIIDNNAVIELLNRVDYNFETLHGELQKLEIYAIGSKRISLEEVELLVSRNLEDNLFELSNYVIEKDKEKALRAYYDLLVQNIDPITIIGNLSSKIKETITTKHLLSKGLGQQSIADYFNVSSGRAYYMVRNARTQNLSDLEEKYNGLATIDYKIKSGRIDKKLGLELWLLEGFNVK